jgi:hypothetical protein
MNLMTIPMTDHPSHHFMGGFDPEEGWRCGNCDCRPMGLWAPLPCGLGERDLRAVIDSVPTVESRHDASDWLAEMLAWALRSTVTGSAATAARASGARCGVGTLSSVEREYRHYHGGC